MFKKLIMYIAARKTPTARALYRMAKMVRGFNTPVIRPLHRALYSIHMSVVVAFRWMIQKFYAEPLFKSRCASCGKGLTVDGGIPLVSSHLRLYIGDNVFISGANGFVSPLINPDPVLVIGDGTMIGSQTTITAAKSVKIGKHCLIARRVFIADTAGHPLSPSRRHEKVGPDEIKEVVIGDNVWIGHNAVISPGVTIGNGAIVGTNAVVTQDVPENSVVMGAPARVVRILQDN
jgi:acetyltransferase-like isoleucine patch superfamily enzyme